jgi:peroxiredoxin (alkyl hydroperoxide reductase subunit C)
MTRQSPKMVIGMALVGEKAPDFACEAYVNGEVKNVALRDFKGKWVVLFFYPRDFTFVCPTEIRGFAKREAEFSKANAVIVGASTDSAECHQAWFERDLKDVKFPILADTNHKLSRDYGVLIEDEGKALRGTFIIDPDGVVQYAVISGLNVGRSVDETLRVLLACQNGGLCPVDWEPGQKTL